MTLEYVLFVGIDLFGTDVLFGLSSWLKRRVRLRGALKMKPALGTWAMGSSSWGRLLLLGCNGERVVASSSREDLFLPLGKVRSVEGGLMIGWVGPCWEQ